MIDYHRMLREDQTLREQIFTAYSATELRSLYDNHLRYIIESNADSFPTVSFPTHGSQKYPRKQYLVGALITLFTHTYLLQQFYDQLSENARHLLAMLTWEGMLGLDYCEQMLQEDIVQPNTDDYAYAQPYLLLPSTPPLVIISIALKHYEFRPNFTRNRNNYFLMLLPEMRNGLKKIIPPPKDYELHPMSSPPSTSKYVHCNTQDAAFTDIPLALQYFLQGHVKFTKTGLFTRPTLVKFSKLTSGSEFFPTATDKTLQLLRASFLLTAAHYLPIAQQQKFIDSKDYPALIQALFRQINYNTAFFNQTLSKHIKCSDSQLYKDGQPGALLAAFFSQLPADDCWISDENLLRYHALRETCIELTHSAHYSAYVRIHNEPGSWLTRLDLTEENRFDVVTAPLLRGYAFLLAALGLAEIAYTTPKNEIRRQKKAYLTPFDGLYAIRLTPLGLFVFGKRKTCPKLKQFLAEESSFVVDDKRLLVYCSHVSPVNALALDKLMEPISPTRYRMTHQSILKGCKTVADLEEKITLFRHTVSSNPPAIWEHFFAEIIKRINPLTPAYEWTVFQLPAGDDFLHSLFSTDPTLQKHTLKVEGRRIAVQQDHLPSVINALTQHGYLSATSLDPVHSQLYELVQKASKTRSRWHR